MKKDVLYGQLNKKEGKIMDLLGSIVGSINNIIWSYVLIGMLVCIGVYFTLATKFVQIRLLGEMMRLMTQNAGSKGDKHKVSSFQAFCISTASRVGVGNIAGVAIAGSWAASASSASST